MPEGLADQQAKAVAEIEARRQEIEALEAQEQTLKAKIHELSAELEVWGL